MKTKNTAEVKKRLTVLGKQDTSTQLNVQAEAGFSDTQMRVKASLSPSVGGARLALGLTHKGWDLDLTTISWY